MTREEVIKIFNEVLLFGKARCTQAEFEELAKMAIKALEQEQYYKDLAESYEKTITKLTKAVTLQEPRWIPVSEKLPKAEYGESDSVLVCFETGTQDVLYFNGSNWCYPTGETYISVNHKNDWHNKVIAWMPLPKPYKAESEET